MCCYNLLYATGKDHNITDTSYTHTDTHTQTHTYTHIYTHTHTHTDTRLNKPQCLGQGHYQLHLLIPVCKCGYDITYVQLCLRLDIIINAELIVTTFVFDVQ